MSLPSTLCLALPAILPLDGTDLPPSLPAGEPSVPAACCERVVRGTYLGTFRLLARPGERWPFGGLAGLRVQRSRVLYPCLKVNHVGALQKKRPTLAGLCGQGCHTRRGRRVQKKKMAKLSRLFLFSQLQGGVHGIFSYNPGAV